MEVHQHVIEVPPNIIIQPVVIPDHDNEKWLSKFMKKFVDYSAAAMNVWNLACLTGSVALGSPASLRKFRLFSFFGYMVFSAVAVSVVHSLADKPAFLKTATLLGMVQFLYLMTMFCFEAHTLAGLQWDVMIPYLSFACTLVAVIWLLIHLETGGYRETLHTISALKQSGMQ